MQQNEILKLSNKNLSIKIRRSGAKIISLKYKKQLSAKEILYIPKISSKYPIPKKGDTFDSKHAWGVDICAPAVSKGIFKRKGISMKIEDHGNFWTKKFKVKKRTSTMLKLIADDKYFQVSIIFELSRTTLKRKYAIKNLFQKKLPFTFADHFLLPINDKMSNPINFYGTKKFIVEYSFKNKIGKKEDLITIPTKRKPPFADKLFGKLSKRNGFYNVSFKNNGILLIQSSKELSNVGYWHTEGGWHNEYNIGLELTNTLFDDINDSVKHNSVWWINSYNTKLFQITTKFIKQNNF